MKENDATDTHSNFSNTDEEQVDMSIPKSIKVLDRFDVILSIFASRANSVIAKFQLEIAYLKYARSRLTRTGGSFYSSLETFSELTNGHFIKDNMFLDKEIVSGRQGAGLGSMGGSGEKQIEVERRLITNREISLNKKLEEAKKVKQNEIRIRKEKAEILPSIALIGYTNSGKTAIMNLVSRTNLESQNRLFETLNTTVKR